MDVQTLPIVLQSTRELAEIHLGNVEADRWKILTPFPPVANDFPDFNAKVLGFGDPANSADAATDDVWNAYNFFVNTDRLYYDFSYALSADYRLSEVCKKFYDDALFVNTSDTEFVRVFTERKDAFQTKSQRQTVKDLGNHPFVYASPSPIQWNASRIVLTGDEIGRLKAKALAVYSAVHTNDTGEVVKSLIAQLNATSYGRIEYDVGFFDVNRDWIEPQLIDARDKWKFRGENEVLYGEDNGSFDGDNVKLCYVERYYLVKECLAPQRRRLLHFFTLAE